MATTLPRIDVRTDQETHDLLTKATAISGASSVSSFVLSAATKEAHKISLKRVEELWEAKPKSPEGHELDALVTVIATYEETDATTTGKSLPNE
jgi:hypothetical protein